MPFLNAFKKIPPKTVKTILTVYGTVSAPDAFQYFSAQDVEVIFAATSAINNCELCLSFHGMTMTQQGVDAADIAIIVAGGVPEDARLKKLVTATKYAIAHKGIYLEREKKHLSALGLNGEGVLYELNFIVAQMSSNNMVYICMISDGLEIEDFLHPAGPFASTVYAVPRAAALFFDGEPMASKAEAVAATFADDFELSFIGPYTGATTGVKMNKEQTPGAIANLVASMPDFTFNPQKVFPTQNAEGGWGALIEVSGTHTAAPFTISPDLPALDASGKAAAVGPELFTVYVNEAGQISKITIEPQHEGALNGPPGFYVKLGGSLPAPNEEL